MHILRRITYHFVSVLFFVFLVFAAWTATATLTFSKPTRLESWLSQSKLYDHFVATAIEQSQKSVQKGQSANSTNSGGLSLNDPAVQQAAKAAFTPQVLRGAVNTFLDANYAWLEGKTAQPQFRIDFTQAKNQLADNLGIYAGKRAIGLPKCTPAQLASIVASGQEFDPLSATCLPPGVTPAAAAQSVRQKVATSPDFLADPVITPQSLSHQEQGGSPASQPYYVKFSQLPRVYKLATKLPLLLALVSVLAAVALVFLAFSRRKGLRRVGTLLFAAGIVIMLLVFVSSVVLNKVETQVFTDKNVGQLQQALVDFAHRAQAALNRTDLWFGVSFILAGIIIWILLWFTRKRAITPVKQAPPQVPQNTPPRPGPPSTPKPPTATPPRPRKLVQL